MSSTYDALREHVFALDLIDTHEHLPPFEKDRNRDTDVLAEYLGLCFQCDLISAGLSDEALAFARDHTRPIARRWEAVATCWACCRNTGYARSLDIAARELYDVPRIDRDTIEPLNEAFLATLARGGQYHRVLREKAKIVVSIEDHQSACVFGGGGSVDPTYFLPVVRCDHFIAPAGVEALRELCGREGVTPDSLDDLKRACHAFVDRQLQAGAVGLKCGLAYARTLRFETTSERDAEEDFARLLEGVDPASLRRLQDHMMHFVCSLADARRLPFQIHTGLQEGSGNFIRHADPTLLSNLFLDYPNVRFDLFHIGYPYQQTMSALAKNFRNVFIDFAWVHIISPEASVRALVEYLDAVPANKISGFGGDYNFIDGVAGHAFIARENIARALAIKVDRGVFDVRRAKELARMILFDNPKAIFNISNSRL